MMGSFPIMYMIFQKMIIKFFFQARNRDKFNLANGLVKNDADEERIKPGFLSRNLTLF